MLVFCGFRSWLSAWWLSAVNHEWSGRELGHVPGVEGVVCGNADSGGDAGWELGCYFVVVVGGFCGDEGDGGEVVVVGGGVLGFFGGGDI